MQAAIQDLRNHVQADRFGVWFAETSLDADFRGIVWDANLSTTPAEWSRLSPEISLFLRDLAPGPRQGESALQVSAATPILGPLVEMRRAEWVPIEFCGQWQGLLLAASRRRDAVFSRRAMEAIAAELALALAFLDQRILARNREEDLALIRRIHAGFAEASPAGDLLAEIAVDCTQTVGAGFVAIGRVSGSRDMTPEFLWSSGDPAIVSLVESEALKSLWRQALEAGHAVGADAAGRLAEEGFARLVALPLTGGDERQGVLVAGLQQGRASLVSLERLELRAALAADALAQWKLRNQVAERAARPRSFLRNRAEALFLLDAQGRTVDRSAGALNLLGADAASSERIFIADLFLPRAREAVSAWWQRTLAGEDSPAAPLEVELPGGAQVRLGLPIPAGDDHFVILLEQAEQPAGPSIDQSAEVELRTLLEWLEQGVVLFDVHQRVRAMNARFTQIAGLDPQEAGRIKTLDELIARMGENTAEDADLARRWRETARQNEGAVRDEIHLVRPVPRILERAARPVLDAAGNRIGWLEIYRDLTAQRVFQSKLLQTEKLAALGQMVTGVAHELSNPLTSILGYAQRLLLRDKAGPGEEVRKIYQEAERASRILRQLLLSGRDTRPERRPISLNQIVLRALELQRFGLSSEKIRVETDLDSTLPLVLGDVDQLQQVVTNLLANAQQAIEQESGRGNIIVRTRREGERRLQLEVSDSGPGIPAAILARIFDPFFTTKPAGLGTGLGLSIVLGIVREHGGQVHVSNRAGGGAAFTIELPALAPEQIREVSAGARPAEPPAISPTKKASSARSAAPSPARVLVVEDEPTVARLIADVLEDEGLEADVLLDGREALQRAAQRQYDLLICDLKMPGLDGQHFYQALVHMGSPLRDHAIFVTGDTLAAQTLEFLERNHLAYVAKPFRVDELTQAVRTALPSRVPAKPKSAAGRKG